MIVRPVDFAVVQQMNEVSHIKQEENQRPVVEQQTITTQVQKKQIQKQNRFSIKRMPITTRKSMMPRIRARMNIRMDTIRVKRVLKTESSL